MEYGMCPGGWDYQRIAQLLGKMAWNLILRTIEVGVDVDFDHPQINAVPGFARMLLQAQENRHGRNPVHAVLLAESETLDVVLENKNFVDYLMQEKVNRQAIEMGFTYLLGPILVTLRPRLLTVEHLADLRRYADNLWQDAHKLEKLWRREQLDDVIRIGEEETQLALSQTWQGSLALMVSDGLFSFGTDLLDEEF